VEQVLIRLNTTYTPNGTFGILSDMAVPDVYGNLTRIGYDAAVCLQLFEPWIVETYNATTGTPVARRILGPGNEVRSFDNDGSHEKKFGPTISSTEVERQLNSTDLTDMYISPLLHQR
jgi:hypothetical protein